MSLSCRMKVGFVLPGPRRETVGGYKVVYQYADYLASQGVNVSILYPTNKSVTKNRFLGIVGSIKCNILKYTSFYNWYVFDNKLNHIVSDDFPTSTLKEFDILVCTAIEIYNFIEQKKLLDIKKVYFVQDYENWVHSDDEVNETFSNPEFKKITISSYLKEKIENAAGEVSCLIPNGIDDNVFKLNLAFHKRKHKSFVFMYHPSPRKGCDILLSSIQQFSKDDGFVFECFSVYKKPKDFPENIKYNYRPSREQLCEIYNRNRFFVCSSRVEGFGLTPAESALCGCIVLTTNNGGVNQYISDKYSGFFFKDNEPETFVDLMTEVTSISDVSYVSDNAIRYIKDEMVVEKANSKFLKCLESFEI
ncbi:glycosyltransferase family 4 protein [Shewanella sp. 0m-11]